MLSLATVDLSAQTAVCQDISRNVSAAGVTNITAAELDNGSSGFSALFINTVGNNNIDVSCTDSPSIDLILIAANGISTDQCTATVTLTDTDSPTALCQNITADVGDVLVPADIDNASSDACTSLSFEIDGGSDYTVTCSDASSGTITLQLEVTDASGNSDVCNSTITVSDASAPVASCSDFTLNLSTGNTITASDVGSFTDNCTANVSESLDISSFSCANIGTPVTVTYTADDSFLSDDCTAVVTVVDDVDPMISCLTGTFTLNLDASGNATLTEADIFNAAAATDNCNVMGTMIDLTAVDCTNLGMNTVTATVTDDAGLTATCTRNVMIQDVDAPTAICSPTDITVQLDATGNVSIIAADVNSGSTDNCTAGLSASPTAFTCADVGSNLVTLTVSDGVNATSSCTATVVVEDDDSPDAVCQATTVTLAGAANTINILGAAVDGGSSDICGIQSLSVTPNSFDCTDLGPVPVTVTLLVTDNNGNTDDCTTTVTVQEQTGALQAVCQNITLDLNQSMTIAPADVDGGSLGDCGLVPNNVVPSSFACTDLGAQTVTLVVTDNSASTSTCNATVTVVNPASPNAMCITDITVQLDNTGNGSLATSDIDNGSFLEWAGTAGVTAVCGSIDLSLSIEDYNCTDVGKTTIVETLTATDPVTGATASCTTNVTVEDMNAPTAICQPVTISLMNGEACVTAIMVDNGSTDECNSIILGLDRTNFTCADLGTYTVTMTATDGSGNEDDCTAVITIEDNVAPTAICNTDITVNLDAATGTRLLAATELNNGSHDQQSTGGSFLYIAEDNLTGSASVSFIDISTTGTSLNHNCDDCSVDFTTISNYDFYGVSYNLFDVNSNGSISLGTTTAPADLGNEGLPTNDFNAPTIFPLWDDWDQELGDILWEEVGNKLIVQWEDRLRFGGSTDANPGDGVTFQMQFDSSTGDIDFVYTDLDENYPAGATNADDAIGATIGLDNNDGVNFFQYSFNTARPGLTNVSFTPSSGPVDNCTAATDLTFSIPPTTYACSDVAAEGGAGTFIVTLEVADESGNTSTCMTNVTVRDVDPPTITCMTGPVDVVLDATGAATVNEIDLLATFSDPCIVSNFTFTQSSFSCADVDGTTTSDVTVTVGASDDSGNNAVPCSVDVNVLDNTPPTLTCVDLTSALGTALEIGSTITPGTIATVFSDACGTRNMSFAPLTSPIISSIMYPCVVATHSVTVYAEDANGNTVDCTVTVELVDTSTPNVTCFNPSSSNPLVVNLDDTGNVSITPPMIGSTTDPACSGTLNVSLNPSTFDCTDTNMTIPVVFTATDGGANTVSCTSYVFIQDLGVEPELTACPVSTVVNPIQVLLDPAAAIQLDANDIATSLGATMTDDCGTAYWAFDSAFLPTQHDPCNSNLSATPLNFSFGSELSSDSFDCADEGTVLRTTLVPAKESTLFGAQVYPGDLVVDLCFYRDHYCRVYIELVTDAPVAVCQDITVQLDATGNVIVAGSQVDGGSTDDCSNDFSTLSTTMFDCSHVATSPELVTLTVSDFSGNTDQCTANITVEDNVAPIALCQNVTVFLDANGDGSVATADFENGSSDNCGIASMSTDLTTTTFTCTDHGLSQAVIFTVTDVNGNTTSATCQLDVQDNIGPVITCPVTVIALEDFPETSPGSGIYTVNKTDVLTCTDNCGIAPAFLAGTLNISCANTASPTSPFSFLGLTDVNGNFQGTPTSCAVQVLGTAPEAMCQTSITVGLDAAGAATIDPLADLDNGSVNACDNVANVVTGMMTYAADITTFDCTNIGANTVTLTVTDEDGMTDDCVTTVNIIDLVAPTPVCATGVSVQLDPVAGQYVLSATEIDGGSSDNCSYVPSITATTFGCADIGTQSVNLTVTDPSGNTQTTVTPCTVNILEPAPVAECVASYTVTLDAISGSASITPADIDNGSSDICNRPFSLSLDDSSFDCTDGAMATVILTAADNAGNSSNCTATVNITDAAPVAECQDITVDLDMTGNFSLLGNESMVDNGSADVCGEAIVSYALDVTSFDCTDLAASVPVVLTVTDESGQTDDCTANVTVEDNLGPDMECQDFTVSLDAAGNFAGLSPTDIDNGSMDACDGSAITLSIDSGSPTSFDCTNLGMSFTVILNGTDSNGNLGVCSSLVTVQTDPAFPCSCVPDFRIASDTPIPNPVDDGFYPTVIDIETDATVPANGDVHFRAGNSILLLPGFEVILSAEFLAEIGPCQ